MKARAVILRQLGMAATDATMVTLAFLLAFVLRFHSGLIPLLHEIPPLSWYTQPLGIVVLVHLLFFRSVGLYVPRKYWRGTEEFGTITHGAILAGIVLLAITFFYRGASYSRVVVLLAVIGTVALVTLGRLGFWRRIGQRQPRLLIIGTGSTAEHLIARLNEQGSREIIGLVDLAAPTDPHAAKHIVPIVGTLSNLPSLLATRTADEVILTEPGLPHQQIMELIMQCEQALVNFRMVPDLLGMLTTHVGIQSLDGIPLLGLRETPLSDPWNRFAKGTVDIAVATAGLIVTAPLWILIAAAIKAGSPGPVFYVQDRVGQDGRVFTIFKFRTMRSGAESGTGPVWSKPGDARRTRVGRWLRRWNLDELPQLLNVLKRDMSLVGPRPERPHFVQQFKQDVPRYMTRHRIRSGITGWAQVHGFRGDTSIAERTKYDLYYLENWSLWLDCKILYRSLIATQNAY